LSWVEIAVRKTRKNTWVCHFDRDDAEVTIWDHRGGKPYRKKVTDAEMDQFKCPKPAFGEFDALIRIVLDVLRSQGYGELE
jgi:hypothetical protein